MLEITLTGFRDRVMLRSLESVGCPFANKNKKGTIPKGLFVFY